MSLSPRAEQMLKQLQEKGGFGTPTAIYRMALPPSDWWKAVSSGAKAKPGDPYWEAAKNLMLAREANTNIGFWPIGMYEKAESLPPITDDEALAVLDRFLMAEVGRLLPGTLIHQLQWDVLAAFYLPLRERYQALVNLMNRELIAKASGSELSKYHEGLIWPVTINDAAITRMRKLRLEAKLPTFRRTENLLSNLYSAYPNLIKVVLWMVVGGGLVKAAEFLFWYLLRWKALLS